MIPKDGEKFNAIIAPRKNARENSGQKYPVLGIFSSMFFTYVCADFIDLHNAIIKRQLSIYYYTTY